MRRAAWAIAGIVIGYWEFRDDLEYWLPALGTVYGGQVVGQTAILTVLAAIVLGSVVWLSYRGLSYLLD
jgi:hypothetical protein